MIKSNLRFAVKLIAVFMVASPFVLLAQPDSPSSPSDAPARYLTIMGFMLGTNTLADVQAQLEASPVTQCSHAEEASKELCYLGNDGTRVVFESGFSGGWSKLDAYKVIGRDVGDRCYLSCARTTRVAGADVESVSDLRLGMSRKLLLARLGQPKTTKGGKLVFQWHSRQRMTKEQVESASKTFKNPVTDPYYDVQDTIKVTLSQSKVVEFEVEHLVTF